MVIINKHKVGAVIFDLDGTLYDNRKFKFHALLYNIFHLRQTKALLKAKKEMRGIDYGNEEAYRTKLYNTLAEYLRSTPDDVENWYMNIFFKKILDTLKKHCQARPHTNDAFKILRDKDIRTAVLSDFPFVEKRLDMLGVDTGLIDYCVSCEEYGALKPASRPFKDIADKFGVEYGNTLVIGDNSDTDGAGAKASGMPYIEISNKKSDPQSDILTWKDFYNILTQI